MENAEQRFKDHCEKQEKEISNLKEENEQLLNFQFASLKQENEKLLNFRKEADELHKTTEQNFLLLEKNYSLALTKSRIDAMENIIKLQEKLVELDSSYRKILIEREMEIKRYHEENTDLKATIEDFKKNTMAN